MKILVNGCSHSALGPTNIIYNEGRYKKQFPGLSIVQDTRKSWVSQLSSDLKIKNLYSIKKPFFNKSYDGFGDDLKSYLKVNSNKFIVNLAEDGKGNDSIFMDTISTLYYFKKLKIKLDFVVVQWSGPSRRLVSGAPIDHYEDALYQYANPHEYYEYGVNLEPTGSFITINNMMILQNYFQDNNINYAFLNYFPLDERLDNSYAYKELDLSKFLVYKNNHPIFDGWIDSIVKDKLSIDKDGHPNDKLQEMISSMIVDSISKNKRIN